MNDIDNDAQPLATDKNRPKKYIILKSLGKGSFGRVKEALHVLSGEKIAIKILEKARIKKDDDLKRIRREMNILSKVNHPNIVQLYETIETYKYFFFVMEYAKVGELSDYIEKKDKLSEKESCKLFQQLISSVEYLHKLGCAHRDIKPSNILLDESVDLKLIDFGLGNLYSNGEKLNTACGSPCYAAPEIISGQDYDPIQVDIWSSGITLYCMTVGCLPFDEETKTELYQKILSCSYSLPKWMSGECADLIKRILVRDPKQRLDMAAIKRHPWFQLHQPVQISPGIIHGQHEVKINRLVCKLAAQMQSLDYKTMREMLVDNDHNKYTTLYFLLIKKEAKYEQIARDKGMDELDDYEKGIQAEKRTTASKERKDASRKNSKMSMKDKERKGSTDRYDTNNDNKLVTHQPVSETARRPAEINNQVLEKRKKVMDNIIEKQRQKSVDDHVPNEETRKNNDYVHVRNRSNDVAGEHTSYHQVMKSIDRSLERHENNTPKIPKLDTRTPPVSVERRNITNNYCKNNDIKDLCTNQITLNEALKTKYDDTALLTNDEEFRKTYDRTPKIVPNKSNSIDANKSRLSQSRMNTSGTYYDTRKSTKANKKIIDDLKKKVYDKKIDGKLMNQTMMEQNQQRPTSRDLSKVIESNLTTDRDRKNRNYAQITQKLNTDNSKNHLHNVLKRTTTPVNKNQMLNYNNSIDSKGLIGSPTTNHNSSNLNAGTYSKRNSSKIYKRDGNLTMNFENSRLPNSQRDRSTSNNKSIQDYENHEARKIKLNANSNDPTKLTNYSTRLENSSISRNTKDMILDKLMPKLNRNNSKQYPNLDDPETTQTEPVAKVKDPLLNHVITTKTTTKTEIYHTYNLNQKVNKKESKPNYTDRFANEHVSRNSSDHSFTGQNKRDQNLSAENRYYDRNQTSNNRISKDCSSKNSQKRHKNNINFNLIYMNNPKVNMNKRNSINLNKTQTQQTQQTQGNQENINTTKEEKYATSRPVSKKKTKGDYNYNDLQDLERLSKTPGALTHALKSMVKKKNELRENNFSIDTSKNKQVLRDNNSIYRTNQDNSSKHNNSYQIYKTDKLGGSIDRKKPVARIDTKGISNNFTMNYPMTVDDRELMTKENTEYSKPPDSHDYRGERRAEKRRNSKNCPKTRKDNKYNVVNENDDMLFKSGYYD